MYNDNNNALTFVSIREAAIKFWTIVSHFRLNVILYTVPSPAFVEMTTPKKRTFIRNLWIRILQG